MSELRNGVVAHLVIQGPGRPATSMMALRELVARNDLHRFRAAVAYATSEGVRLLQTAIANRHNSLDTSLIVSLDGFVTQAQALRDLRNTYGSRFKVIETVANRSIFHSKAFFFDSPSRDHVCIFTGSANLTGQGLGRNTELGVVIDAHGLHAQELKTAWDGWWDDLWNEAHYLTDSQIAAYEDIHRSRARPTVQGDRIVDVQGLDDSGDVSVSGVESASVLWIDVGAITGGAGNQLQLLRVVVPYFGVSPNDASEERLVTLRLGSRRWDNNVLRYYPINGMWRLNIDTNLVVETGGLTEETVYFAREGPDTYQFRVLTHSETNTVRNVSESAGGVGETSTREYGWY